MFTFERKSSSPQIAPTICWSCRLGVDASWSPVIQSVFAPLEQSTSAMRSWNHSWPSWRPLLSLYKASSPSGLTFIFAIWVQPPAQANTKRKCSSPYLNDPQASKMHFIYKMEKGKEETKQKMYCLRRKREQLRTWMLLLPLSMNL